MKKIILTKGAYTLVDDEDFEYLNQWKWYLSSKGYAMRGTHVGSSKDGSRKTIHLRMHRIINNTPEGLQTDHINRDKLDNRKENLRSVTNRQNQLNRSVQKNNTSGHNGVYWHKLNRKWVAFIKTNEKVKYIASFENIEDAIKAREEAEKIYHV